MAVVARCHRGSLAHPPTPPALPVAALVRWRRRRLGLLRHGFGGGSVGHPIVA
ncbi:hypothetical protein ACP4OV_020436 [Aristida adscensionis]